MIYLDNAATTAIHPEVLDAMMPYLTDKYFNASSLYEPGMECMEAIDIAREQVAELINAEPRQIIFTSGATEGNNWVLNQGMFIASEIEHPSVRNLMSPTSLYKTRENGQIDLRDVETKLYCSYNTPMVSCMLANNETGVLQPMEGVFEVTNRYGVKLHTDATQAVGHIDVDVQQLAVDYLTMSAHKFNGPKGVGAIFVKDPKDFKPFIKGGHQERPGTYNTAAIVGMGKAAELALNNLSRYKYTVARMRTYLEEKILSTIPNTFVNGGGEKRLPSHTNICFRGVDGYRLQMWLAQNDILVSTGSACSNGEPSYVLKALGLSDTDVASSIRFSLSSDITQGDCDKVVEVLQKGCMMLTD